MVLPWQCALHKLEQVEVLFFFFCPVFVWTVFVYEIFGHIYRRTAGCICIVLFGPLAN